MGNLPPAADDTQKGVGSTRRLTTEEFSEELKAVIQEHMTKNRHMLDGGFIVYPKTFNLDTPSSHD